MARRGWKKARDVAHARARTDWYAEGPDLGACELLICGPVGTSTGQTAWASHVCFPRAASAARFSHKVLAAA